MCCWVVDVSRAKVITWLLLDPHPQRMTTPSFRVVPKSAVSGAAAP